MIDYFISDMYTFRILAVLEGFPNGISNQKISEHFDSQTPQNVLNAMNKLLSQVNSLSEFYQDILIILPVFFQNKIEILQLNQELFYKLKAQTTATEGLDDIEEQIVYEHIERSGNQGIWIRDIRNKTNLMLQPLNKILKSLESKQKIKSVKSVLVSFF
jgi:DNA-directed RNA polymerase III subunit RPC6